MKNRHLFSILSLALALLCSPQVRSEDDVPVSKEFSIPQKKGTPPMQASLVWENSSLQAIEIHAAAGGPVVQRIKVGELEMVGCDLDQANLPPHWIGTLDYNKDGYQDIYVQVAQGSDTPYAVLLYDAKKKQFVASKALANVTGLNVSGGKSDAETKTGARKLEDSFGVVSKAPNEPAKLSIGGPALGKGDSFHVVSDDQKRVLDAEVVAPRQPAAEEVIPEGASSYTIEFVTSYDSRIPDDEAFVGTAVMGAVGGVTTGKGPATTTLANSPAGERLYFRNCTSTEGMHFTVWAGKPLSGKRVWHAYHYLGYDVEPNCTPKDVPQE